MAKAIVFDADRTGYSIDQVDEPVTVGDLIQFLEDFNEDDIIILSHDRGYTFGTLNLRSGVTEYEKDENGEWAEAEW